MNNVQKQIMLEIESWFNHSKYIVDWLLIEISESQDATYFLRLEDTTRDFEYKMPTNIRIEPTGSLNNFLFEMSLPKVKTFLKEKYLMDNFK